MSKERRVDIRIPRRGWETDWRLHEVWIQPRWRSAGRRNDAPPRPTFTRYRKIFLISSRSVVTAIIFMGERQRGHITSGLPSATSCGFRDCPFQCAKTLPTGMLGRFCALGAGISSEIRLHLSGDELSEKTGDLPVEHVLKSIFLNSTSFSQRRDRFLWPFIISRSISSWPAVLRLH